MLASVAKHQEPVSTLLKRLQYDHLTKGPPRFPSRRRVTALEQIQYLLRPVQVDNNRALL